MKQESTLVNRIGNNIDVAREAAEAKKSAKLVASGDKPDIKMKGDICRMGRYPFSFVLVYTFTFLTLKKLAFILIYT